MALLWKMICNNRGSYESSPPCTDMCSSRTVRCRLAWFAYCVAAHCIAASHLVSLRVYQSVMTRAVSFKESWVIADRADIKDNVLWYPLSRQLLVQHTRTDGAGWTTATRWGWSRKAPRQVKAHCNTLQHTATHCNTLQHTAAHCNTLQHTAEHCNTLQHTATHCNTLQHTATHCNTLQHTATHCNTL